MDELDEEVYSTIFNALRHGVRRNILRMLEEREHSFTDIEEKLDLSSSHLTYHLDSLKELITKKDTGYKLSVFGRAAVEMIKQVEDPHMEPSKIERNHRILMLVLVIGIIITSSLFTSNYYQLIKIKEQLDIQIQKVESLEMQLSPLSSLSGELKTRPFTHFSTGIYAVSGWTIQYKHDLSKSMPYDDNHYPPFFYAIFYSPLDNLTLYLEPGEYLTPDVFSYPLTLQKGHAWWDENGERIVETYSELNITLVYHQSPVIYRMNVSDTQTKEIPLQEKGWYTLSMTGPIRKKEDGGLNLKIGVPTYVEGELYEVMRVDTWIDITLLQKGEEIIFGVWNRSGYS